MMKSFDEEKILIFIVLFLYDPSGISYDSQNYILEKNKIKNKNIVKNEFSK